MGTLGAGFVRVSTGSQDETSQVKILTEEASQRGITIVKWFTLHGYSASRGAQEPALREAIADIQRRDYRLCALRLKPCLGDHAVDVVVVTGSGQAGRVAREAT
ncbi:recombinase family protein [Frankia sp. BMG5.23]|uniref:recombinase family protein n=1 Tax=Frankia sp. BMG5.23 TaxID=683305 RepID=UPI0004615E04|nr:recombinase family protein [Frankia sp. BMG5.23]KDA45094.1 hypothetical protein BMG523Draft_00223 [Frankia sp. BMG5.23]